MVRAWNLPSAALVLYVRSRTSAATGLTGLDVCLWGRFARFLVEFGRTDESTLKTIAETMMGPDASITIAGPIWGNLVVQGTMSHGASITVNSYISGNLIVQGQMKNSRITVQGSNLGVQGSLTAPTQMFGDAAIIVGGEIKGGIKGSSSSPAMDGNAKIQAVSCGKPTTMTGVIQGAAAITGTGC